MSSANETLIEYLRDAESAEQASISLLEGHLRGAPPGPFRTAMRRHLDETRRHAHQVGERLTDLGASRSPVGAAVGLGEAVVGRVVGLALAPVHVLSGRTGADQLVREAQDEIASEAREIAAYTVIERLAEEAGDDATASLARTIRGDEERHLETVHGLLETLAGRVARERIRSVGAPREAEPAGGEERGSEDHTAPDAATAAPTNGGPVKTERTERETPYRERAERRRQAKAETTRRRGEPTRREMAREREQRREQEVVVETEGAGEPGPEIRVDAPWDGYDAMKASEIVARLAGEDAAVKAMVRLYEETNKGRKSILDATGS